jgi:rRNA maturation protein Nop10
MCTEADVATAQLFVHLPQCGASNRKSTPARSHQEASWQRQRLRANEQFLMQIKELSASNLFIE